MLSFPNDLAAFALERAIDTRIPGLSMALLDGNDVVTRHVGFRDLARRTGPADTTRYGIGSVTKLLTAVATLELVEAGAFALDDPIGVLLPELAGRYPPGAAVRHLLSHSSGMPALGFSESKMSERWFMDGYPVGGWPDVATFLEGADSWWTDRPGTAWRYGNEGYLALGALIERTTQVAYPTWIQRTVLEPLGMHRSTFSRDEVDADEDRVTPVMQDPEGRFVPGANLYGPIPAAGGLVSTVRDLAALASCLMNAGRGPSGETVLQPRTIERLADVQIAVDAAPPAPFDALDLWRDPRRFHGLGAQVVRGIPGTHGDAMGHGGGVMGGTAFLLVDPAARRGVVALASTHGYPLARLSFVALAALAGEAAESLAFVRRERLAGELCGRYSSFRDTIHASLRPAPAGFELTLDFRPAPRRVSLTPLEHDPHAGVTRLLAMGSGPPAHAEVHRRDGGLELRFERYALRRRGRLSA